MKAPLIHVTSAPLMFPNQYRENIDMPHGLRLSEIVRRAVPGLADSEHHHLRVVLVAASGAAVIDIKYWHMTRPNAGVRVIISLVPGNEGLRSVLLAIVSIAAIVLSGGIALAIGVGALGKAVIGAVLTIVGGLLVNALVPVRSLDISRDTSRGAAAYAISGWRNRARPDEPIPMVFGRHRTAPPFAATSYTEIVGDTQYVRALFCFGYGPLKIEDLRLGETSISEFDEVEVEIREGRAGDAPMELYPRQVLEDAVGAELVRPLPRDNAGDVIDGASVETPVVRHTAADTQTVSAIIGLPSGLFAVDDRGSLTNQTVTVRIRQRLEGAETWVDVVTLNLVASNRISFFRQYNWDLPSRGKYEIEITRMTDESDSTQVSDTVTLAALQSIRPEYPLNINKPLVLVAMRIKATFQLNGALDDFNAVVQRYADAWDGNDWIETLSRNPAAAYIEALRGPSNPYPVATSDIDMDQLADWHDWCATKGLKYDRVHEQAESLDDMLRAICAAGRATPRHDGLKWGVVIDRPDDLVIDHINPRNSSDFSWSRTYFEPPHAFRIAFQDETNGWDRAERIVRWPGYTGDITLTEALDLPGKTDPDEIWIEARRRQYELMHRADTFTAVQSGMARVVTRGDLAMGSFDVLSRSQLAARVKSASGLLVEIDDVVSMEPDKTYGLQFRQYADPDDVIGVSLVRQVVTDPNATSLLRLLIDDALPAIDEAVHFGELTHESIALKVRGIEGGEAFSSILNMVAAAPEIDTLTDAEVAPAWSGRVGSAIVIGAVTPPAPQFTSVTSTATWIGAAEPDADPVPGPGSVSVLLTPGTNSAVLLSTYRIEHKLSSAGIWSSISVPVVNGGGDITGYLAGNEVNLRAVSIATDATESEATATLTITVGQNDAALPASLDAAAITVQGGLGHAAVILGATSDINTTHVQLYRVPTGDTLDPAVHGVGAAFAISHGTTISHIDGDATRVNLLSDPGFDTDTIWSPDANWSLTSSTALHLAGVADDIQQTVSLTPGKSYRMCSVVSGRVAGTVTPTLFGGTNQSGTAISADGESLDMITAVAGNTAFGFTASSDFDGALNETALIENTTATAPAGFYNYWLQPLNVDGNPGAMAGPYAARIV